MFFVSWQQTFLIQEVALRAPAGESCCRCAPRQIYKVVLSLSLAPACFSFSLSRFRGSTAEKTTFVIFAKHKFRFCCCRGAIHIKASAEASRGGILSIWTAPRRPELWAATYARMYPRTQKAQSAETFFRAGHLH